MLEFAFRTAVALGLVLGTAATFPWIVDYVVTIASGAAVFHITLIVSSWLRSWLPRKRISASGKAVFITGCDSGFGHQLAKRLDAFGFQVFAGCLDPKGQGARDLHNVCSSNLCVVPLDVTNDNDAQNAAKIVQRELKDKKLWAVINNAGIAKAGEIEWCSMETIQSIFDVNTFGIIRVTNAFLPLLRQSRGRVVNITSYCVRVTCPGFLVYCMSKSAASAMSDGLRIELEKFGIKVVSVEPWLYKTSMTTTQACYTTAEKCWDSIPSEMKDVYGAQYIEEFKYSIDKFLATGSNNMSLAVNDMVDAVVSAEPRFYYQPAHLMMKLPLAYFNMSPPIMKDFILHTFAPKKAFGIQHQNGSIK